MLVCNPTQPEVPFYLKWVPFCKYKHTNDQPRGGGNEYRADKPLTFAKCKQISAVRSLIINLPHPGPRVLGWLLAIFPKGAFYKWEASGSLSRILAEFMQKWNYIRHTMLGAKEL